jgi:hypothetical protein
MGLVGHTEQSDLSLYLHLTLVNRKGVQVLYRDEYCQKRFPFNDMFNSKFIVAQNCVSNNLFQSCKSLSLMINK